MKRNYALIGSVSAFAVSFLSFWYADVLFNRFFVLGLLPLAVSVLLLLGSLCLSIVTIINKPSVMKSYFPIVISMASILVLLAFPFSL